MVPIETGGNEGRASHLSGVPGCPRRHNDEGGVPTSDGSGEETLDFVENSGGLGARRLQSASTMDQLLQNLKVATRSLLRQRAFSLAAVLTLALGIGAASAIFSVVYAVLLRPLQYPESERLVTLGQTAKG